MLFLSIILVFSTQIIEFHAEECPNSGIICSISDYVLRLECDKNAVINCNFNNCILQRFNYTKVDSNLQNLASNLVDINEIISLKTHSCLAMELSCMHRYTKEKTCIHLKSFCELYAPQIFARSYENDNRAFINDICKLNGSNLLNFDCGASFSISYNMVVFVFLNI
jgi:hypothetical protein